MARVDADAFLVGLVAELGLDVFGDGLLARRRALPDGDALHTGDDFEEAAVAGADAVAPADALLEEVRAGARADVSVDV